MIAARAGRDMLLVARVVVRLLALRVADFVAGLSDVVDVARAPVMDCEIRAGEPVRTCCVVRAVVFCDARDAVPRDTTDCVPDVRGVIFVRETVGVAVFLDIVAPSRTAALAMPTLTIYAIIRSQVLFIP